jgi:protein-tyrosine-phosphatase
LRVLFLCTGNSARSQIAEALLQHAAGSHVEVASAGSHPKPVHPNAVRVMREYGIDLTGRRSKHLDEFTGRRFDYVITLCDKAREVCPEFGDQARRIHWSIPDPAAPSSDPEPVGHALFGRAATDIDTRIRYLLPVLAQKPEASP